METRAAGQRLDHYEIISELGRGAFSAVYEARDERDGKRVVLKCPDPALLGDQATFERFRREMEIGRLLDHPNIQRAVDAAETRSVPYLVLEYVDGRSFRDYLGRNRRLAAAEAVGFAKQIASALDYAHARRIYHRDLKPENVLITPDGQLKLIDFGIAYLQGARRLTWKWLSNAVGTPDYMSPEQIQGGRGDARSDLYALGIMLYEMLAGRTPYQGDNAFAVMDQHLNAKPSPPSRYNPAVPPGLNGIVLRAIRKDPLERYQSAADLLADLDRYETLSLADFHLGEERMVGPSHPNRMMAMLIAGMTLGFVGICTAIVLIYYVIIHH
ncbi:MAG TPA: serine/threonine-protein kinase [Dehalococcoidia bacterium]|nr:serine/threonine-protein kinase [Dehalococcoidia bacterium]